MIATSHRGDIAQQSLSLSRCSRHRRREKKKNKNSAISSSSSFSDSSSSFESTSSSSSSDRSLSNLDNNSAGSETLIVGGGGEYYYASNPAPGSPTTNTKLSIQDRLRLRSGNKFKSVVCLGCSPRAVVSDLSFDGEEEVFVDGEDVFGMHDEYLPSSSSSSSREGRSNRKEKMRDGVSSELMQKSAFAVEMAVRKIRSTYFAATTRENKHFLVREERDPRDGRVMHLSIREARLSERLRRRMEKEQMSQIERMGRGFPILDV